MSFCFYSHQNDKADLTIISFAQKKLSTFHQSIFAFLSQEFSHHAMLHLLIYVTRSLTQAKLRQTSVRGRCVSFRQMIHLRCSALYTPTPDLHCNYLVKAAKKPWLMIDLIDWHSSD